MDEVHTFETKPFKLEVLDRVMFLPINQDIIQSRMIKMFYKRVLTMKYILSGNDLRSHYIYKHILITETPMHTVCILSTCILSKVISNCVL